MDACWLACCRRAVVKRERDTIESGTEIAGDTCAREREDKAVGTGIEVIHDIYRGRGRLRERKAGNGISGFGKREVMRPELLCCYPVRWVMGAPGTGIVAFVRVIALEGRNLNFFCRRCIVWIASSSLLFSIARNSTLFGSTTGRLSAEYLSRILD